MKHAPGLNPVAATLLAVFLTACGDKPDATASKTNGAAPAPAAPPVRVTVSGVSSGAYMATQVHVAASDVVSGATIIAGGPWGCARGEMARALGPCMKGDGVDDEELFTYAEATAAAGTIASLDNLADDPVFVFHGARDTVVAARVADAAAAWYRRAGSAVVERRDIETVHGWPTMAAGAGCTEFVPPYINACNYDLAGEMLGNFYPDLAPAVAASAQLTEVPQEAPSPAGLADHAYAYVPAACAGDAACDVHVVFHGCGQSAQQVGMAFIEQAGVNEYAEANGFIALYPQVAPSPASPQNPLGCWDWWGYTGADYLERDALQVAAVLRLVDRLRRR